MPPIDGAAPGSPHFSKTAAELGSAPWLAHDDLRAFGHRARLMQFGYPASLPPLPGDSCGYGWMFRKHITQAHEGGDLHFLETAFGAPVRERAIH